MSATRQKARGADGLRWTETERGFALAEFRDFYDKACSVQRSSIATEDCIWLGISEAEGLILPGDGTGWHPYPIPDNVSIPTRMHLSREQVASLLPALTEFAKSGNLPPEVLSPRRKAGRGK